ncbi:MAG: hypothetical protein LBK61_12225 [Spirochaetaceae bacterium]|jgi:hypothetical protein|nr:hypothetical protein [Spirochaetaceae bacterium]
MIFFLNRGLILEQETVKALKKYFAVTGVPDFYENFTVSVTNDHPFARMALSENPQKDAASLFPVIVVATEYDEKPPGLEAAVDSQYMVIEPADIAAKNGGGKSDVEERYMMMTPKKMGELRSEMEARTDKRIFGFTQFIRRRERVSIEIWAENPQLKNELYEIVRLFACGFMRDYLAELYREYFKELDSGNSPLAIFDGSVKGQRSNNFNLDFGVELFGAQITFDADYIIEQSVIDTEIIEINGNLLLEVINHVKGYADTTREWVIGADGTGGGDSPG